MKLKISIALIFFFIASSFGLLMRITIVENLGFNYKYFLHTHSHIAFLGWLYNLAFIFIQYYYFKENTKRLNLIFWVSQLTFIGMLLSFPFQGYAFWSILFSTLYLFASYWLVYEIFKRSKEKKTAFISLRAAGIFLVLSSIGPYLLGIVMAKNLHGTIWYDLSLYWFLHFLFNGFFFLVFLGLLISEISKLVEIRAKKERLFYYLMIGSIPLLYAGFALDNIPSLWMYLLTFIGSSAQLIALVMFYKELVLLIKSSKGYLQKFLISIVLFSFALKLIFQLLSSLPIMKDFIFHSKPTFIIGYLHLVMLGMFSLFFIWLLRRLGSITKGVFYKIGIILFLAGVILSETVLFTQGFMLYTWQSSIPNYYVSLYSVSAFMPLGTLILCLNQLFKPSLSSKEN